MIGILAGMGPKSTAPFIDKVVDLCQRRHGARHDSDFPPMLIYSCPTPFYLDRPVDHAALRDAIVAGAARLAACGVDYLAVPCNLAHVYFGSIQEAVPVPVLNMVAETVAALPADAGRIAVLATAATLEAGIYQQGLAHAGRESVLAPRWQAETAAILELIKSGRDAAQAKARWDALVRDVSAAADAAVIACTDLNVVADGAVSPLPLVDSSACLATALVDRYYRPR
ncbi:aspartate/glutamate racemase family protein [Anaeroselena agilis]|uniref:Aspartate/glutamate racemase family protein n=1 Tax=Anaeroselena agilis TaxID=3063788 RepID=A0ABU3P4M1_9FIRM|nr:aspartate/glutamate racemase family protein [Selenomonadales bacterium 4137-cl]